MSATVADLSMLNELSHRILAVCESLSVLHIERAASLLRPPKEISRSQDWVRLARPLQDLVCCESSYLALSFLQPRRSRGEALEEQYARCGSALERLVDELNSSITNDADDDDSSTLIGRACNAVVSLQQIPQSRVSLIGTYRMLQTASRPPDYERLKDSVLPQITHLSKKLANENVAGIRQHSLAETNVLFYVLSAQISIETFHFKDTIVNLALARQHISSWNEVIQHQDNAKRRPVVLKWFSRFCTALLSKASLYFHSALKQFTPQSKDSFTYHVRALETNYAAIIEAAVQKAQAGSLLLIYNSAGLNYPVIGADGSASAFVCPNTDFDPPQGLRSWPVIASFPRGKEYQHHLPNVISLLIDHQSVLMRFGAPLHHTEKALHSTYVICAAEPRMFLVQIIDTSLPKRTSGELLSFVSNIAARLRNLPVLQALTGMVERGKSSV